MVRLVHVIDELLTHKDIYHQIRVSFCRHSTAIDPVLSSERGDGCSAYVYAIASQGMVTRPKGCMDASTRQIMRFRGSIEKIDCYREYSSTTKKKHHFAKARGRLRTVDVESRRDAQKSDSVGSY